MRKRRPSDTALDKCPIHAAVIAECLDDLKTKQVFNKEDILTRLRFNGIADAIYWDYIRRKLENGGLTTVGGQKLELLPVSGLFFKHRRPKGTSINSVLAGPGGKAAGFATATVEGGVIALHTIKLRVAQTDGLRKATEEAAESCAKTLGTANDAIANAIRQQVGHDPVGTALPAPDAAE